MMDNSSAPEAPTGSDEARSTPAPRAALLAQPSTWTGLWVILAMAWLIFARGSFRKLG